jgi:hypothetical protein
MRKTRADKPALGADRSRLSPLADLALRVLAVVLIIAGAAIGFGKPVAIVLVAVGLLLLLLEQSRKHWPRKPIH